MLFTSFFLQRRRFFADLWPSRFEQTASHKCCNGNGGNEADASGKCLNYFGGDMVEVDDLIIGVSYAKRAQKRDGTPAAYASMRVLDIVPITSRPTLNPERSNCSCVIRGLASMTSSIDDAMDIATSITAPRAPMIIPENRSRSKSNWTSWGM